MWTSKIPANLMYTSDSIMRTLVNSEDFSPGSTLFAKTKTIFRERNKKNICKLNIGW